MGTAGLSVACPRCSLPAQPFELDAGDGWVSEEFKCSYCSFGWARYL